MSVNIGNIKADHLSIDNTSPIQKLYDKYDNISKGPTSSVPTSSVPSSGGPKKFVLTTATVPLIGTTANTFK